MKRGQRICWATEEERWRISSWTTGKATGTKKKEGVSSNTPTRTGSSILWVEEASRFVAKVKSFLTKKIDAIAKFKFLMVTLSLASVGFHL